MSAVSAGASAAPAGRLVLLLAAIRKQGGAWGTADVQALYRRLGVVAPLRATCRRDLAALHRRGLLVLHDDRDRRHYTPKDPA